MKIKRNHKSGQNVLLQNVSTFLKNGKHAEIVNHQNLAPNFGQRADFLSHFSGDLKFDFRAT